MTILHIALWTRDLDRSAEFYKTTFGAVIGAKYHSKRREGFISQFARFKGGTAIELMTLPNLRDDYPRNDNNLGWAHVAISVGSEAAVDAIATQMKAADRLLSAPRWTGDGFFEAVIQDPDGNLVEVTC